MYEWADGREVGGLVEVVRKSVGVVGWRLEMESRM